MEGIPWSYYELGRGGDGAEEKGGLGSHLWGVRELDSTVLLSTAPGRLPAPPCLSVATKIKRGFYICITFRIALCLLSGEGIPLLKNKSKNK